MVFICRLTTWQSRNRTGTVSGSVLDSTRQSFGNRRLAHTRLADEHHRVRALAMAQNLEHLLNLALAAKNRRQLVLTSQQIEICRKVLEERRQFEPLFQPFFPELDVAEVPSHLGHHGFGFDTVPSQN